MAGRDRVVQPAFIALLGAALSFQCAICMATSPGRRVESGKNARSAFRAYGSGTWNGLGREPDPVEAMLQLHGHRPIHIATREWHA